MGAITNRYAAVPVGDAIKSNRHACELLASLADLEPDGLELLARIRPQLELIASKLAKPEPFVALSAMERISDSLNLATGEITAYCNDRISARLLTVNSHFDDAMIALSYVPSVEGISEATAVSDAIRSVVDLVDRTVSKLGTVHEQYKGDLEALRNELSTFSDQVDSEKQRLTILTTEFQAQFSSGQDLRSNASAKQLAAHADEFSQLLKQYNTSFARNDADLRDEKKEREDSFSQMTMDLKEKQSAHAQLILDQMEADKTQVEKLVGVIGNLGVTSGYLRAANLARLLTYIWQATTVVTLIVLAVVAIYFFLPPANA